MFFFYIFGDTIKSKTIFTILLSAFLIITLACVSAEDHGWAGSQYNETLENANATGNTTGNATGNATVPVAANTTATNATNATAPQGMLATGNPIFLLLGVLAVAGGYVVLRRKQ